jgi:hypothetical protein
MPAVSRLILILQVLWPESLLIAWVSRFLFARFLYSPAGSSFHPAALALRPASATCTAVLACLFAAAFTVSAQDMPLPNPAILTIQAEAQGRERAVARQIDYQVAKATPPKAAAEPKAPRHLTPMEVRELMAALDAYFREHAGRVPVFWTPEARP